MCYNITKRTRKKGAKKMSTTPDKVNLCVDIVPCSDKGLFLRNPVMNAATTASNNGVEMAEQFDINKLGAFVSKGLTLEPRQGNAGARIVDTPAGMLNSIGFENIGLEALVRDIAPVWASWNTPVVVNMMGDSLRDFAVLASALDRVESVSALEVNISCPNVERGGLAFGRSSESATQATQAVKNATRLPVIVKLTPDVANIQEIALAVEQAGADALCVANSFVGMAIDVDKRTPRTSRPTAGLTGSAIKPLALRLVWEVAQVVSIPVIGCGGIATGRDAVEFLLAGATAVQVGTALFRNPRAVAQVVDELVDYCVQNSVSNVNDLIGDLAV